jgi:hypothetical protein
MDVASDTFFSLGDMRYIHGFFSLFVSQEFFEEFQSFFLLFIHLSEKDEEQRKMILAYGSQIDR